MRRIILCLLALSISAGVSAQTSIKKKKKTDAPATTDSTANQKVTNDDNDADKSGGTKFDYKAANAKAAQEDAESASDNKGASGSDSSAAAKPGVKGKPGSKSTSANKSYSKSPAAKPKPAPRPKPMTAAEKKKAEAEAAEIEAATPKGIEALYYKFPLEYLPVVKDFMDYKQAQSPQDELHRVKVKDDNTMRKQIIRFKDIDKGYLMLQKPGESKYTRMQVYKMTNGNLVMAVEQSDCPNGICSGTHNFYTKTAGGWRDATEEYYPQSDYKFVIDRLKSAYKKEYKDLELYNSHNYEDNDANLKKAITYQVSPDDGSIVIQEENLPCKLYSATWDIKKEKFVLKKIEK